MKGEKMFLFIFIIMSILFLIFTFYLSNRYEDNHPPAIRKRLIVANLYDQNKTTKTTDVSPNIPNILF